MTRNIRNIVICLGSTAVVLSGVISYMITVKETNGSVSHIQTNTTKNNEMPVDGVAHGSSPITQGDTRHEVAASIHLMANMLIIAEDNAIEGLKPLTKENLDATAKLIEQLPDGNEKANFVAIITRWRNCDFSHAVDDHNYVWGILGEGQDKNTLKGRAVKINQTAIKPITNLIKRGDYGKSE